MNQPYNPNQQQPQYQQPQGQGFGFNVNDYEPQKAFDNLPPAWYNVQITAAEMTPLQSGNGTGLQNQYTVHGGPFNGRVLFDNLNIIHNNDEAQKIARGQLRAIQDAIMKPVNGPMDIIQQYMCIKVGLDKPKKDASDAEKAAFEPRNVVRGYKPFDQALHQQNSQAPQAYNVAVTPMGNAAPNFTQQQYVPQSQPQQQMPPQQQQYVPPQQAVPQQQYNQQQPNVPPQQQQYQQAAPQQQYAPQNGPQQQNYAQPGQVNQNVQPPQGNVPAQGYSDQQGQAQNVQGAMAPGGQPSPPTGAPSAGSQVAPPATFAPQGNGQPPQGNVPPPQQSQAGNAPPPGNAQPPQQQQQQQQAPNQQQMATPNQNYAPPQGQPPQSGTPPPPGAAW